MKKHLLRLKKFKNLEVGDYFTMLHVFSDSPLYRKTSLNENEPNCVRVYITAAIEDDGDDIQETGMYSIIGWRQRVIKLQV